MGFFKDVRKASKLGKEAMASMPPAGERMAAATAQMAELTARMDQQAEARRAVAADGLAGTATIISAAQTGALVNFDPSVQLELLVTVPGHPPYPASLEAVVPQLHLARVQPGATVAVSVGRADHRQLVLDWDREP